MSIVPRMRTFDNLFSFTKHLPSCSSIIKKKLHLLPQCFEILPLSDVMFSYILRLVSGCCILFYWHVCLFMCQYNTYNDKGFKDILMFGKASHPLQVSFHNFFFLLCLFFHKNFSINGSNSIF